MISFEEKTHTYTHTGTNQEYISVTTLLHQYIPEFDSQYWSLYKAVKDVLEKYNQFKIYKISVGGWEKVVRAWRSTPLTKYQQEVEAQQLEYLIRWDVISEQACETGTAEHKRRELDICSKDSYEYDGINYETPKVFSQSDILHIQDFTSNRIYPELLVYNDKYMVAGQVDYVRKRGRKVWIKDYKTSKIITKEAFRDQKMKAPLHELYNANYYEYAMQLSMYGWMLEQCGYEVQSLEIIHTRTEESYIVPYMKNLVEALMEDYSVF